MLPITVKDKDVNTLELLCTPAGTVKWCSRGANSVVVPHKVKNSMVLCSSRVSNRHLYTHVHCITHNS